MVSISGALASAFRAYQTGNLFEAEWTCQQIVQQQPGYVPALHLLGAIAYQTGRLDTAIARYQQILRVNPNHAEAHGNLAVALQERKDWQQARMHFQRALELDPDHAPTHFNFGNLLRQQEDWEGAIAQYQQAIALNPNYARAHNNLANVLRQWGEREAAVEHYYKAIALEPDNPQTYNNLGNVLQEMGQFEAAIAQYQKSLTLQADNPEVYFNLGNAMSSLGQFEAAITYYHSALNLGFDRAEVYNNLGLVLRECNYLEQAVEQFQRAISLAPNNEESYVNLGSVLYEQNDLAGAITQYRQAIALNPDHADAHLNLSFALLASGDLEQGFVEYEWRFKYKEFGIQLEKPRWDGSDLRGKTILLFAEMGLGDAIHCIRYVPLVAQKGGQILVDCRPELVRLFSEIPELSQVIPRGASHPPYDVYSPLFSLPHLFGHTLDTIPAQVPYLPVPDTGVQLPERASENLNVGIAWASAVPSRELATPDAYSRYLIHSYKSKTASLPLFMALQSVPGVKLYSLQVGSHAADISLYGFEQSLVDLSNYIQDLADTATLISQLDLVISVDTAVAHLSGALGKPVWVVLPFACDWRWMQQREDSPWYPTMRLFRQDATGDWAGAIAKVVDALREWKH